MARVKRGVAAHRRHKDVLAQTKGQWGSRHRLYKRAHEALMRSLAYAYAGRRLRRRDMRQLWIARISAASRGLGLRYSELIHGLQSAGVEVNRKMLAEMAVRDQAGFAHVVGVARQALGQQPAAG
ncbi:MAG: 50S ribosomal protein L20 [Chloroflexi bacterium]|nr:50S ribosomal protein L20 [Chloroflexota bacterium]